jgi:uncharacterized protein (UPF0333 family)
MKKILVVSILIFMMIFLINNCKKSSELQENEDYIELGTKTGTFKFYITADSASNIAMIASQANKEDVISLVVTIENLDVHRTSDQDAGWISLPISDGTFDLMVLDATSWAEIISNTEIAAGNYNKFRFDVTGAQVTTESGVYEAEVPSGTIKVNVPFIVQITIEIDPKASLKVTGNKDNPKYKLNPVLKVTNVEEEEEDDDDD